MAGTGSKSKDNPNNRAIVRSRQNPRGRTQRTGVENSALTTGRYANNVRSRIDNKGHNNRDRTQKAGTGNSAPTTGRNANNVRNRIDNNAPNRQEPKGNKIPRAGSTGRTTTGTGNNVRQDRRVIVPREDQGPKAGIERRTLLPLHRLLNKNNLAL